MNLTALRSLHCTHLLLPLLQHLLQARELADAELQRAIQSGVLVELKAAIAAHAERASAAVLLQAEQLRTQLRESENRRQDAERKAERMQRQRKQKEERRAASAAGVGEESREAAGVVESGPVERAEATERQREAWPEETSVGEARTAETMLQETRVAEETKAAETVTVATWPRVLR